jgi:hypothetical protein
MIRRSAVFFPRGEKALAGFDIRTGAFTERGLAPASGLKPLADNMQALRAKAVEPIGLGWNKAWLQPDGGSQASILLLRLDRDTANEKGHYKNKEWGA